MLLDHIVNLLLDHCSDHLIVGLIFPPLRILQVIQVYYLLRQHCQRFIIRNVFRILSLFRSFSALFREVVVPDIA